VSKLFTSSNSILGIIEEIDISKIRKMTYCIRSNLEEEIDDLAKSIYQNGLLHPIIVRMRDDFFEIVAGNRRYNAYKRLGWRKILCHIAELTDKEAFEVSLTENIHKRTLNPIDEALAFKSYIKDFGWGGVSELARRLGRSTSYVSKRINLLKLPSDVINSVIDFKVEPSIAEELLYINDKYKQSELAKLVSKRNLSLRRVRTIIQDFDGETSDFALSGAEHRFEKAQKSFDKSIIALRIALNKLCFIIQQSEDNWLVYEMLMQHKNMLHNQIDLLIRHKKKLRSR
jgi:ParB family transcriptional regulator, chromosome partitioning protein